MSQAPAQPGAGRWRPGKSGNPRGRPPSPDFRTALGSDFERLVAAKLRELVEAGDLRAISIAAERLWPALARQEVFAPAGGAVAVATVSVTELSERIERLFAARRPRSPSELGNSAPE